MNELLTILLGDALKKLRELPAESVHCCVTSPPYWGLRDYGTGAWEGGEEGCDHKYSVSSPYNENFNERWGNAVGAKKQESERHEVAYRDTCGKCGAKRIDSQLGLEKTPEEYVAKMVEVFREVRRVLRKDGTLWLNLGDSYASASACDRRSIVGNGSPDDKCQRPNRLSGALKEKDLCGIPWRVALALQADGWWLRSDVIEEVEFYCPCGCGYVMQERVWRHAQDREIIWKKPNPMPESCTDRPTKAHEYIFLLTKSASYFYDAEAIKEPVAREWDSNGGNLSPDGLHKANGELRERGGTYPVCTGSRNKRSVWTIATQPYPEAHFATFPEELPKLCILAGTSAKGCCAKCGAPWDRIVERGEPSFETTRGTQSWTAVTGQRDTCGGLPLRDSKTLGWQPTCQQGRIYHEAETIPCTVLDPFAGSGTTGKVSLELGRKAILIDLNPKYLKLIDQRCDVTPGLQLC